MSCGRRRQVQCGSHCTARRGRWALVEPVRIEGRRHCLRVSHLGGRFETNHHLQVVLVAFQRADAAGCDQLDHHQRRPDVRPEARFRAEEAAFRHAYDGKRGAVEGHRTPDGTRRSRESALPERIAQNDDRMRPWCPIVVGAQDPPRGRTNAEDVEVVSGYELAAHAIRDRTVGQVHAG